MQLISVSHETAPQNIRGKVALTREKQLRLMERLYRKGISSTVLCTCNRFELYTDSDENVSDDILSLAKCSREELDKFSVIKRGDAAARHLFETASGLRSMVLGEDQILGQIKTAFDTAREHGFTDSEMNTLFRLAVTAAKRIKTDTLLSKTPVSMAGIGLKAAREALGGTIHSALIIGAGGKTGSIILRDLPGVCDITATIRSHGGAVRLPRDVRMVDYDRRYGYIDGAELIVSATSSPHYTLCRENIRLKTSKKRVFLDMAVPADMDIAEDENSIYINVDMLKKTAEENNIKKRGEAEKALPILEKYLEEYYDWRRRRERYGHKDRNTEKSSCSEADEACYAGASEELPEGKL